MLQRFFELNRRACRKLEPFLPQTRPNVDLWYERRVAEAMNERPRQLVVDVGGGKSSAFARYRRPDLGTRIVAVDVSEEETSVNRDADETRVADVVEALPFADGEVDLVVSSSVLEHLVDLDRFVGNAFQALRPGGAFIHVFASKFAPATLVNQLLPQAVAGRLVRFLRPESGDLLGFPAYYDRCYYSAAIPLLRRHGFEVVATQVNYYQSPYFAFFLPFFLVSALYETVVWSLGARNLGARLAVVARKPAN